MAASRLSIYNGALTVYLGDGPLDALDDDVPARYALASVWDRDGLKRCLAAGQWNFAARTTRRPSEPGISPEFGYRYAFQKPEDYVRLLGIAIEPYFTPEGVLENYNDEAGYW